MEAARSASSATRTKHCKTGLDSRFGLRLIVSHEP